MKKVFFWVLCLLPWSLNAATYYASPDGTGDGKSYSSPTTLTAGIKKLKNAGDTLYLLSGQYNLENTPINNLNGSASKRIVIAGYEGITRGGTYSAVLDFRKVPYGTRGLQVKSSCSYLHIKNLTLRYSGKNNLYNEGSYCLFENLDIYGSADTGCQMKVGGNNIIKNVDSHDNFDYETMSGDAANFGGNADGFADKQFTGDGNHYIGCRAWNNSDDGWDFFQRVSTSETIMENCICYRNGEPYYNMKNHPRYETDKAWFDSKVGTQMVDRYGETVTITLEKYPCQGNGNGFKMGGALNKVGTDHKIRIHHCLAVANNARGFDQNNNGGTMWVYNCTAYDNQTNYGFTTAFGTNSMQNNISFNTRSKDSYKSKSVAANDHNSWNSGFSCSKADFLSLDTTAILAPRRSDGALPDNSCLRLASTSALIDAGIDVGLSYNGKAPDLGCYESDGEQHNPDPVDPTPTEQPEGTHSVAWVSLANASADKSMLSHLRKNDSLWVVVTDATDAEVDYSGYEVLVLSGVPNSGVAGFAALKGYNKPIVLLKPFLLKNTVWDWGTSLNTQDESISVRLPEHPIFRGLTSTDGQLTLFSECNTNAVTAISEWTNTTGVTTLASPVSQPNYTSIADIPAGTNCNGTVLKQRLVMVGVSEYSTAYLTNDGLQLIENAILYLLGIERKTATETISAVSDNTKKWHKELLHGHLLLHHGEQVFDITGKRLH